MTALLHSLFAFLLGLSLVLFGIIHTFTSLPDRTSLTQLVAALPALGSVLLFVLCLGAGVGGVLVTIWSGRRLRYCWRYLRAVRPSLTAPVMIPRSRQQHFHDNGHFSSEMDDERDYAGAY
jgi:hypothetical protein